MSVSKSLIILVLASFYSLSSFACSCVEWTDARQMMKEADTVVLAVPSEDSQYFGEGEFAPMVKTGMKVVKKYKGKYSKFFYLISDKGDGANCGLMFNKYDGLYLIFGYKHSNEYYASSMCDTGLVLPGEEDDVSRLINELEKL